MSQQKYRPKQYEALRDCGGKKSYPSKAQAEIVKDEQELMIADLKLSVYRCSPGCGKWHLTRTSNQ